MIKKVEELPMHYFKEGLTLANKAIGFDKTAKYEASLNFYKKAKDNFLLSLHPPQLDPQLKDIAQNYVYSITRRLDEIKKILNHSNANFIQNTKIIRPVTAPNKEQRNSNTFNRIIQPNNDRKKNITLYHNERPNNRFEDIICSNEVKNELIQSIVMPFKIPQFFQGVRKPYKCILLYGPNGCGKSFISKFLCQEIPNVKFFQLSSTQIISNIINGCLNYFDVILTTASSYSQSIIFIDEIDLIFYESSIISNIKSDILYKMENLENSNQNVFIICTTSIPWQLPHEVIKIFKKKIYVPLPDFECRKLLLKSELKNVKNTLSTKDIETLANLTKGFSVSDIFVLIKNASIIAVKKVQAAKYFVLKNSMLFPCSESTLGCFKSSFDQLSEEQRLKLAPQEIDIRCFSESLQIVKPSNSPIEINRYDNWKRKLGNEGF